METRKNTRLLRLMGGAALLVSSSGVALADTVGFNPNTSVVAPGDTFSVDIVGIDFAELAGGVIDLGYDGDHVQINDVRIDPYFDFAPDPGGPAIDDPTGPDIWPDIGFDVFVNDPAVGDFTIATIDLTASEKIDTSELVILDGSEFFSATAQLDPTLTPGPATISTIPVPAAVWLFGSGLLGLIGLARRNK
jgi:hypothetical protein